MTTDKRQDRAPMRSSLSGGLERKLSKRATAQRHEDALAGALRHAHDTQRHNRAPAITIIILHSSRRLCVWEAMLNPAAKRRLDASIWLLGRPDKPASRRI